MGLDSAEIVMEIEDTFGIEFSDDDWASMSEYREMTAGDLCEVVQRNVHLNEVGRVDVRLNLYLWNEMRRLLHSATGRPEHQIRLSTELQTLFPQPDRPRWWEAMRGKSRLHIRELDYPQSLKRAVGWSVFLGGFVAPVIVLIALTFWNDLALLLLIYSAIFSPLWLIMLGQIYKELLSEMPDRRYCFPADIGSVKDLCRSVRNGNYAVLCDRLAIVPRTHEGDVWPRIRNILSKQLSIPLDEIQPESRLIEDLKMD